MRSTSGVRRECEEGKLPSHVTKHQDTFNCQGQGQRAATVFRGPMGRCLQRPRRAAISRSRGLEGSEFFKPVAGTSMQWADPTYLGMLNEQPNRGVTLVYHSLRTDQDRSASWLEPMRLRSCLAKSARSPCDLERELVWPQRPG